MTVLEEYKVEVDSLIDRLDNMSFGFIDADVKCKKWLGKVFNYR